jgi:alkylation response protein AidB-like acyl-CoA dehydrogenase
LSTENAISVAQTAQQLTGDHGYFERFELDRYLRDFYGLVPIVGGQYAIETQLGERVIADHLRRSATPMWGAKRP